VRIIKHSVRVPNGVNHVAPKLHFIKDIHVGSTIFLKNGFKQFCRKAYQAHFRSSNHEVCTAAALLIPNILDVMVLENI
jgi:DNA polymerase II small subunit/DNA polymerase delta subunit B